MKYAIVLLLASLVCSCSDGSDKARAQAPIRLSVLPDQAPDELRKRYLPLIGYLERATKLDIDLQIPGTYLEMLQQFDQGKVDLAWFGGLTFVEAEFASGAEPLVMRDVDRHFSSCYLVRASDNRTSLAEFEGEHFSFGPQLSTSGHLMPRHFMTERGFVPEQMFKSIRHASGHDHTAILVTTNVVAIGVANCVIIQAMIDDGRLGEDKIRILESTPPYSNYVYGVPRALDETRKTLLRDAFLALDATDPAHRDLLRSLGTKAFFPAARADFDDIRTAAERWGLLSPVETL